MGGSTITHVEDVSGQNSNGTVHAKTFVLVVAVNMVYFAQLISVVGSGSLGHSIAAVTGATEYQVWFTSSITILTAALSPPVSQAADYWGRKWPLVFFTSLGCIGSVVVSRANSPGSILAGFVISGIGFGAQPLVATISSEVLPRRWRPFAQGFFCSAGALSAVASLLFGGALVRDGNNEGFRVYYYVCAGVFALSALLSTLLYNPPPRNLQVELKFYEKLGKLDWPAYALLTGGTVLFCMGLSWSQNPYSWSDPHVVAPFVVGVGLLIGLISYALFVKKDGIVHHKLFLHRNFAIALGCQFVEGLSFFASNNYWPSETRKFLSPDTLLVGANYTVAFIAGIIIAGFGAAFSWKTKLLRPPSTLAFVLFIIFDILAATITINTPDANFWVYPIFVGGGMGLCLANGMTVAQFATPLELLSTTTGLILAVRNLGGTVGLAIYNAIFNHCITSNLASKVAAATLPLGLPETSLSLLVDVLNSGNLEALSTVPGITSAIKSAAEIAQLQTYVIAYRYVWVAAGAFSASALVATFFIVERKTDFNAHVDAPVEDNIHKSAYLEKA
ncbi:major facilitator superfamily domain-containing protein [Talaromyces proteolyticus]|uniref:Major facilitator superfamily domain-containing protein n=1 Tax=Talaromyces proteolyticus TaxID=1131652 RepID=A0AAD4L0C4_9EURO|nr:major facilitator superfamily domain-containing protein [Talaromyces proteolyticus]KAH8703170.1 major facilitator superfamily domain-containing protein [Talaromyces proteolyticus]